MNHRLVGDVEGTFFVRDYQRGYRWGVDEVRRLLDDIKDAGGRNYYLQPVVVKRLEDGRWELVDGQQRLTTLYLVLRYIKRHMPTAEPRYTLSYETRPGSAAYLDSPTEAASVENIDYFHMYQAFKCIEAWFGEQKNETLAAIEFFTALSKTVYVIWYEAPQTPEFDSRTLFTRLNVGRIPLTDAELVKALLLSRIERKHETAAQWDNIERDLHAPEVWAFATGTADGGPTRISLLLDTIADMVADAPASRDRPLYHTFETLRPRIEESPDDLWNSGRRPALAGPGLVRRPRPLPQDRLSGRRRQVVVPRAGRVGAGEHQDRVRHRTQWPHPRQPQALEERRRVADVPDPHEDRAGAPPDERGDGTPKNAVLDALLLRRPGPAAVVLRAHPRPELARSQHSRAVDRMAARAPDGARRP